MPSIRLPAPRRPGHPRRARRHLTLLLFGLAATTAGAEPPAPAAPQSRLRPAIPAVRTDRPPRIDGRLDDAAWATAAVIDDLRQVEPVEGAAPSEATRVQVVYDDDFLYLGIRCFDSEPDRIDASTMIRDAGLGADDRVRVVIDTFLDRRNGFLFEMNPAGAKVDGLVENNDSVREEWDGIWYGKARIDAQGWTAEMAIPFKTVSFDPGGDRWGLNVERIIRRRTETVRWAGVSQNKSLRSVADAGMIEGFEGRTQGLGIDFKPYGLMQWTDERAGDESFDVDAGFDIFYKLSSSTTLTFTVNTDFAETEVDERRVNLTRFPLFFPEKRDFFLQDAGIFEFGGIRRNPLPFQSRRIGLSGGSSQDILAGVKLTGREGPWNFGALSVQMRDDDDLGSKNFSVGRVALNVLEESTLGMIVTSGDPDQRGDNYVVGGDFNFRTSTWDGDKVLDGHLWLLQSWAKNAEVSQTESSFGAKLGYPNDRVDWQVGFTQIGDEFDAALGFVPRRGIREWFADWRYRWRPNDGVFRRIDTGWRGMVITDLDDQVESHDLDLELLTVETESNDVFELGFSAEREVLNEPFEIAEGVVIPVDDYRFERWSGSYRSSSNRPISFDVEIEAGDFFTGTRFETSLEAELRVAPHLFFGLEYEQNDVDLEEGSFITRVWRGRANVFFTPDVSWTNFVQYDNLSGTVGLNSRLRWIIEPGNELFLVLNRGWTIDDDLIDRSFTQLTTKLSWTFRF